MNSGGQALNTSRILKGAAIGVIFSLASLEAATAQQPRPLDGTPPEGCDIAVLFGSYATKIDAEAYDKTQRWLRENSAQVAKVDEVVWGRVGERTLCIAVADPGKIQAVFKRIKRLYPKVNLVAPIAMTSRNGDTFHTKHRDDSPPGPAARSAQENSRRGVPGGRPW